jgi:hypothetical protein
MSKRILIPISQEKPSERATHLLCGSAEPNLIVLKACFDRVLES